MTKTDENLNQWRQIERISTLRQIEATVPGFSQRLEGYTSPEQVKREFCRMVGFENSKLDDMRGERLQAYYENALDVADSLKRARGGMTDEKRQDARQQRDENLESRANMRKDKNRGNV